MEITRLTDIVGDQSRDPEQVRWIVNVIGEAGGFGADVAANDRVIKAMGHWAKEGNKRLRHVIASALRPQSLWARPILLELVQDENLGVRSVALRSLAPELAPPLSDVAEFMARNLPLNRLETFRVRPEHAERFKMSVSEYRAAVQEIAARYQLPLSFKD